MQLTNRRPLRAALSAASCSLLALPAQAQSPWTVEATGMLYTEADRVTVNENILRLQRRLNERDRLSTRITFDVMTGATPNGAAPSSSQTFTSPSGSDFTVPADGTPLAEFADVRSAIAVDWSRQLANTVEIQNGASYSAERDYQSLGARSSVSRDFFQRQTTLATALAVNYDTIEPVGGVPLGLEPTSDNSRYASDQKLVLDWMAGVTQILNPDTLVQINLGLGSLSGYLSDPYKIISYMDDASGDPKTPDGYYFERRPDSRLSETLYVELRHHLAQRDDVFAAAYRFYADDWGVRSHTLEASISQALAGQRFFKPFARYYSQTAASFYHYYLVDGPALGDDPNDIANPLDLTAASADYRLGNLRSVSFGAEYSHPLKNWGRAAWRLRYLHQEDKDDRFPALDAFLAQLTWTSR